MRYVEFVETKGGRELAMFALERATKTFLKVYRFTVGTYILSFICMMVICYCNQCRVCLPFIYLLIACFCIVLLQARETLEDC